MEDELGKLSSRGFVGDGEGTDAGAMGNRAFWGKKVDHSRARDFWNGECSLALDLAYLVIANVSLDYLHTHHELLLNLRVFYNHHWKIECLLGWHKKVMEASFLLV